MTIVDVLVHKWRMLDNRRQRIILGLLAALLVGSVGLVFVLRSGTKGDQHPDPTTPSPPTPEPPTTQAPPQPATTLAPKGQLVFSDDGLALVSFNGMLKLDGMYIYIDSPSKLKFSKEPPVDGQSKLELILVDKLVQLAFSFSKTQSELEVVEATVSWQQQDNKELSCRLIGPTNTLFRCEPNEHYACNKATEYQCKATILNATLVINQIELEVDRSAPVNRSDPKFSTPQRQC